MAKAMVNNTGRAQRVSIQTMNRLCEMIDACGLMVTPARQAAIKQLQESRARTMCTCYQQRPTQGNALFILKLLNIN